MFFSIPSRMTSGLVNGIFARRKKSHDLSSRPRTCFPVVSLPRLTSSPQIHHRDGTRRYSNTAQSHGFVGTSSKPSHLASCSARVSHASSSRIEWAPYKPFCSSLRQLSTTPSLAKKKSRQKGLKASVVSFKKDKGTSEFLSSQDGLNAEQRVILDLILNRRKNVFFTGPAGTGKSFLLHKVIEGLTIKYLEDDKSAWRIAVTASTGLAAYNIGGTTLHRFAGIGIGKAPTAKLIMEIFKSEPKLRRWMLIKVLIIDEISMVDATLFDKLDVIARAVRGVDKPFGGIQLVITGDFFQLPPVLQGSDQGGPRFCFEAKAWKAAVEHTISLTQIYRQRDPEFASMLNEIREGTLSPTTIGMFRRLSRPLTARTENEPEATALFPLRREADAANARRLHKIKSTLHTYEARERGMIEDAATRKKLLADCMAPAVLQLKRGAQVMLIKNIDSTLVNGSVGRVVGFATRHTFLHDRWDDEDGDGQADEQQSPPSSSTTAAHSPELHLPLYPVVRFALAQGGTRTELCAPAEWKVERWAPDPWSDDGWAVEELAVRTQVPLILGWALSIHKSQGQTLERVRVDLASVFETGQAYVALSRATGVDGLQVLNFDPSRVAVHPKVRAFYREFVAASPA
ncbi:DNA helicase PIF1 ATP-dependent [Macrophomina phaseolina MS6]|uniref:ATP-dependent DNA helicase PIF1 n=1 Tax=Macrophomina phaseolina (strain MS6) TaxID=1126212 RepID=K2RP69_MACPH|nr:DNA helicase PIF1 ATP-dependent [Macrophomina phaseolina MS6]